MSKTVADVYIIPPIFALPREPTFS